MVKTTLVTISEKTGYSVSCVSRVLSGKAKQFRISDKAVRIITEEAQKSEYTPSLTAQSLRTNKTHTIGLIVPAVDNPFFANIASVIITQTKSYGYKVMLVDTMESEADEIEGIRSLLSRNVDGILIVPCGQDATYLERINDTQLPVVLIDRFFPKTNLPFVSSDNYKGAKDATEFLLRNGHRNIVCLRGVPHSMPVVERTRGYLDALKEYGLEQEAQLVGNNFSIRNGYVETKFLLNRERKPTAIFAMSNTILLGAIKAIREANMHIPQDISIISFDDNTCLDYMNPAITRVVQLVDEIGMIAVKMLMESLNAKQRSNTQLLLPPKIIVRDSVLRIK